MFFALAGGWRCSAMSSFAVAANRRSTPRPPTSTNGSARATPTGVIHLLYQKLDAPTREPLLDAIAERIRTRMDDRAPRRYLAVLRAGQRRSGEGTSPIERSHAKHIT